MPRKSELLYIQDMLDWAGTVTEYCADKTYNDVRGDPAHESVLIRAFDVIGESASHLPADLCAQYPQVPWGGIVAMRNLLTHAYSDIDMEIVWKTASERTRELIPRLEEILNAERKQDR